MTTPKTFEEWEKTISHETMYLTGLHRDMARRGWLACEASHADQRERADRLAEAVEKLIHDLEHWDTDNNDSLLWEDAKNCLAAYRNKENQKP